MKFNKNEFGWKEKVSVNTDNSDKLDKVEFERMNLYNISSSESLIIQGYPLDMATYREDISNGDVYNKRYINVDKNISNIITTKTDIIVSIIYEENGKKKIFNQVGFYSSKNYFRNNISFPINNSSILMQVSLFKNKQYNENLELIDSEKCSILLNFGNQDEDTIKLLDSFEYRISIRNANVLTKTNTQEYTPIGDYNPVTKKYVDDNTQLCWLEDYEATGDRLQYADVNVSSLTSRVFYAFNFKKHPGVKTVRLLKSYDDGTIKSIIDLGSTLEYMYLMKISSSIMRFYLKYATGIVSECVCTFGNTSDECTFKRTPMVLYAKNTYEYTPTTDYNPATKKYVDDKFIAFDLMETVGTIPQSELQKCNNGTSRYVSSIDFDTLFSEPNNYMYYTTYKDDTLIPIEYQSNFNRMVTNELDSADGEWVFIGFDYGTHMMYPFNGGMASIKAYTFTNDLIIKRCPLINVNEVATKKYVDDAIANQPTFSFNDSGELVVTINGVTKTFVPKQ